MQCEKHTTNKVKALKEIRVISLSAGMALSIPPAVARHPGLGF